MDFKQEYERRLKVLNEIKENYFKETGYTQYDLNIDDGIYGEYLTYEYLQYTHGYFKTLCNIYIERDNGKVYEIDLVFIHETGIYVIESKNYSGWIFGNEKNKNWTQVLKGGKKFQFYNPLQQNDVRIKALKEVLYAIPIEYFINLVVFSERCELKEIHYDNLRKSVINRDLIKQFMHYEFNNSPKVLTNQDIDFLYEMLTPYSLAPDNVKEKHRRQVNY